MNDQLVIVEKQNRIVTLTLNNPDQRNALSFDLVEELYRAVQEIKADSEVLAVILTGTGKGFSSGGDVSSMAPREGMSEEEAASFIKSYYMKNLSVMDIPAFTIAAINGHAIGAGCTLALACDMRIVSKKAKLGMSFVKIGLHPGMGTTYFLPRLVGQAKAYELLLTGEMISGEEAARIGLVNHAVDPEKVMTVAKELAEKIARGPAIPLRKMKDSIGNTLTRTLEETMDLESRAQVECAKTEDLKEGITAFLEKREPQFKGK
ncbi:MAG: enoyl-CoA hydratase [Deltaproteobacteria bacterium]|nr:enoyl-CoA hydratase [Deltaproteobacteria bacterium]MBW1812795.1 enoyl-CoA hydratase [Deltaproteobacteria bacterium]MBW2363710.1 enoyl-CoA hydratase [Deltaproteobacteria bacterium]